MQALSSAKAARIVSAHPDGAGILNPRELLDKEGPDIIAPFGAAQGDSSMQSESSSPKNSPAAGAIGPTEADYHWYHCIDLGNGVITDGDYDMREYLDAYQFP